MVVFLGLVLRLGAWVILGHVNFPDAVTYFKAGHELLDKGYTSVINVMPLFPLLSAFLGLQKLILCNILLSTFSILLVFKLSMAMLKDSASAILASLIFSCYPFFVFYSITGLTETVYMFLLLLSFLCFYNEKSVLGSCVFVLSILVRPSLELLGPVLVFVFSRFVSQLDLRKCFRNVLVYGAIYFLMMSPWWIHNYHMYGHFVRLNLGDGIVLYSGNNPLNTTGGGVIRPDGSRDMDLRKFASIEDPYERNKAMKKEATTFIQENPYHFLKMCFVKLSRFWRLVPFAPEYKGKFYHIVSLASYGPVLLFSIIFVFLNGRRYLRQISPVIMLIIFLSAVHAVTIGSIRYRLPLEPFLLMIASYQMVQFYRSLFFSKALKERC